MKDYLELIKLIGSALSAIIAIVSFIGLVSKKFRKVLVDFVRVSSDSETHNNKIDSLIESINSMKDNLSFDIEEVKCDVNDIKNCIENLNKASICTLRKDIIDMYNKYEGKGYMPLYAREDILKAHQIYQKMGGNGAIDHLIDAIEDFPDRPLG